QELFHDRTCVVALLDSFGEDGQQVIDESLFVGGSSHGNALGGRKIRLLGMNPGKLDHPSSASSSAVPSADGSWAFDWARASLISRVTSMLFLTPSSSTNCKTGVKRGFRREANFF